MGKLYFFISKAFLVGLIWLIAVIGCQAQKYQQVSFRECWHLDNQIVQSSKIASDNQTIFLPLSEGVVRGTDPKTSAILWRAEIGGEIVSDLKINQSSLFVLSRGNSERSEHSEPDNIQKMFISSISRATGITRWRRQVQTSATNGYLIIKDSMLYVVTGSGVIYSLNESDGSASSNSKVNLESKVIAPPVVANGKIFVVDEMGNIKSATLSDPTFFVIAKLESIPSLIFSDGIDLFAGDQTGRIYKLNIQQKKIEWSARVGAAVTNISEHGENLLVSSSDNFVYFVSKKGGGRLWKKRLPGKNIGAPPISGDTVIFTPLGERSAIFADLKTGQTVNQLTVGAADNFFTGSAEIYGNLILFPTLQGIFAYSANGCQ